MHTKKLSKAELDEILRRELQRRANVSRARTGVKTSEETRRKISEGNKRWWERRKAEQVR